MSYESIVRKSGLIPYRKCYIRRRNASAYETTWYDVTNLIKSFGTVSWITDDVKFNKFEQGSVNVVARNDRRQWTAETGNPDALFDGYATPYKTLFRIDAGYYDTNGSVLPTSTAVFYGIMVDDISYNSESEAMMNINSMSWLINEVPAIKMYPQTNTAMGLVADVRDVRDVTTTGNYILQPFISSTAWVIETTTTQYIDFVSTGLNNYTCWTLMEKLAETENFVVFFGTDGNLHFKNRDPNTTTVKWRFNGPGIYDSDYGVNVIEVSDFNNGWNDVYQRIRLKYTDADTTTSYYTSEQTYTVGDGSSSDLYGVRFYEFENTWLNTAGAITLADAIRTVTVIPKREWTIKTKMITTLNLMDRVNFTFYGPNSVEPGALWGQAIWGVDYWTGKVGGLYVSSVTCKVIRIEHSLDEFTSNFALKEI